MRRIDHAIKTDKNFSKFSFSCILVIEIMKVPDANE